MSGIATTIPSLSSKANAAMTSAQNRVEEAVRVPTMHVDFCKKVKREIKRYGVISAMERWRVVGEYMHTEDWWPKVARQVEKVFDKAYEKYNQQQEAMANRQPAPILQLNNNPSASNPVGVGKADQVIAQNLGDVSHTKYTIS